MRRIEIGTVIGAVALLCLGGACYMAGARVNTTTSLPTGLYWAVSKPVAKGDYVLFCPPPVGVFDMAKERGYIGVGFCPGGYGYMMKRVLAAENDAVNVNDDGVRVNGALLPFSVLRKTDGGGRPMPRYQAGSYTLADYQLLLMSDVNPASFDSRYFGPINRTQVKSVVIPVFTW